MQKPQWKKMFAGGAILFLVGLICLVTASFLYFKSLIVFIGPDERGLVISPYEPTGYRLDVLKPGNRFIYPGERVEIYNTFRQTYTISEPDFIETTTLDEKTIHVNVSVTYALDPNKIIEIHTNWQKRYEDELIRPLLRSETRDEIANFNFNEITYQPSELEKVIFEELETEFNENYIFLLDFKIISIQLSK